MGCATYSTGSASGLIEIVNLMTSGPLAEVPLTYVSAIEQTSTYVKRGRRSRDIADGENDGIGSRSNSPEKSRSQEC